MDPPAALSRLLDENAIRDAIARFGDDATRGDFEAFRTLWAKDAVWKIGAPANAHKQGIEEIVAFLHHLWDGKDFFVQLALPGTIEIDGDQATARTIIQETAKGPGETYYRTQGLYFDRLQRTADGWVFTERSYEYLWLDDAPFTGMTFKLSPEHTPTPTR